MKGEDLGGSETRPGDSWRRTRSSLRVARLSQLAAFTAVAVSGYLSVATSCAPETWDVSVEESVDLSVRTGTRMRLDAHVDGEIRSIRLRAEPQAELAAIALVGPPANDAGTSAGTSVIPTAAATAPAVDVAPASTVPASTASGALAPAIALQADGSTLITCDTTDACAGVEFSVSRASSAPGQLRVFAEVHGGAESCSAEGPSFLQLQLIELTPETP